MINSCSRYLLFLGMWSLPLMASSSASPQVTDIFDIAHNGNTESYYIKKEYYTTHNIEAGRRFFEQNCAVCHGSDGDGSGERASVMVDAKPRMLTNLDWIDTRDDLRLLRSIKYGVPGTAMTPWGDYTSSLQRLQLVIFIRSLTEEKAQKEQLIEVLYHTFSSSQNAIAQAHSQEYATLYALQQQNQQLKKELKQAEDEVKSGKKPSNDSSKLYQEHLNVSLKLQAQAKQEQALHSLKSLVEKERDFYYNIGNDLINAEIDGDIWKNFLELVKLNADRISFSNKTLSINFSKKQNELLFSYGQKITTTLNQHITELEQQKKIAAGRLPSKEKEHLIQQLNTKASTYAKLDRKITSGLQEIPTLWQQEQQLVNQIQQSR